MQLSLARPANRGARHFLVGALVLVLFGQMLSPRTLSISLAPLSFEVPTFLSRVGRMKGLFAEIAVFLDVVKLNPKGLFKVFSWACNARGPERLFECRSSGVVRCRKRCQAVPQARRDLAACGRVVVSHEISMIFTIKKKSMFNKLVVAPFGRASVAPRGTVWSGRAAS